MRSLLTTAIVLLTLAAPAALANENFSLGPVSIRSTSLGSPGCEAPGSGAQETNRISVTPDANTSVVVTTQSYCNSSTWGSCEYYDASSSIGVSVIRYGGGLFVRYNEYQSSGSCNGNGWHYCYGSVDFGNPYGTIPVFCASPTGEATRFPAFPDVLP